MSESKTIEILNQLFNEGLDKNAVFYYEDFGLLNAALAGEKVEVFDYLLDKNCLISDRLEVDLWFNFVSIFMKENLL